VHHALDNRDVVLQARGGQLECIIQNSPSYAALHYVLLFPKGENGWHSRIPIHSANLENERRMQGKEMGRNGLAHRWFLICATMPIVFMSEMVLSHLSSMVESSSSSLWLMHGQIVSRRNSTGLEHINILLDLSSTRDYRMLLCMISMMEKILGLWNANSFFPLLI